MRSLPPPPGVEPSFDSGLPTVADEIIPGSAVEGDAVFSGTREAWLGYIINHWRPHFDRAGVPLPPRIWVSVGRPARGTSTGICYPGDASGDGRHMSSSIR
jgi:hypothetical protein